MKTLHHKIFYNILEEHGNKELSIKNKNYDRIKHIWGEKIDLWYNMNIQRRSAITKIYISNPIWLAYAYASSGDRASPETPFSPKSQPIFTVSQDWEREPKESMEDKEWANPLTIAAFTCPLLGIGRPCSLLLHEFPPLMFMFIISLRPPSIFNRFDLIWSDLIFKFSEFDYRRELSG